MHKRISDSNIIKVVLFIYATALHEFIFENNIFYTCIY